MITKLFAEQLFFTYVHYITLQFSYSSIYLSMHWAE